MEHKDYAEWEHRFEFQEMIRVACETFGASLLSEDERTKIFEAILSGPSESEHRRWLGEQYTDELFSVRRRFFHLKQLRPFATVLFGKYADYFQELDAEHEKKLSDEDYSPIGESRGGTVSYQSPKTREELAALSDLELLKLINEWQEVTRSPDDWLVEITVSALAREFGSIFEAVIATNGARLSFWMQHLPSIERPVYVRAIIEAAKDRIKDKVFDRLDVWFDICDWALTHSDVAPPNVDRSSDESRESPDWHSSRRAVADFVETCLQKEVSVPIRARDRVAVLLDKLCTGFDYRLDGDTPVLLNRDDHLTEAINNTRSRALEALVDFGYWVRRELGSADVLVPEVSTILGKRITSESNRRLTLPEYALLGSQFVRIWDQDKTWASDHKRLIFPQADFRPWLEAFSNLIRYSRPFRPIFDLLREDIDYALDNLELIGSSGAGHAQLIDTLGEHLFTYYLWEVFPLTGNESVLERFYLRSESEKAHWASLFDYVGRSLKNTGSDLATGLKKRIVAFFDWRLSKRDPAELKEFGFWLEASSLEPDWRLRAFSSILDITSPDSAVSMHIEALVEMVTEHTGLVLECFAKLTAKLSSQQPFFIEHQHAKAILQAGFQSGDSATFENAQQSKEQLLRAGRFDLLEVGE